MMVYCSAGCQTRNLYHFLSVVILSCFSVFTYADDLKSFNRNIQELDNISGELRKNVLSLLTLIKELEKGDLISGSRIAKIIYPEASIREANTVGAKSIFTARYNEAFTILDKQDNWYQIRLQDGRLGWINEDAVQVIIVDKRADHRGEKRNEVNDDELLLQMSVFYSDVENQYFSAKNVIKNIESIYNTFSSGDKFNYSNSYKNFIQIKAKIEKYHAYVNKYLQPYIGLFAGAKVKVDRKLTISEKKFTGKASAEFGTTIQNTTKNESGFAGNFDFSGLYRINRNTSVTGAIKYQEEIIRTPFASMGVEAGIKNNFKNHMGLNVNIGYDNYNDKIADVNDFNVARASLNLTVPFGRGSMLSGFIGHRTRNYKIANGNDFGSTRYQINAFFKSNPKLQANIYLRGNLQSSKVDYLNFDQLNPGIVITKRGDRGKSFSTLMDLNIYSYSGEAERSNFSRARLDFKWRRSKREKNRSSYLGFTGKEFPNNKRLNYVRGNLAFTSSKSNLAKGSSKTSAFRSIYTYYVTRDSTRLVDFMDLRYNILKQGRKWFINFNIFERLINTIGRDIDANNTSDMYLATGPVISNNKAATKNKFGLRIGPVLGAHALFGSDVNFWENNGTSLRIGLSLQSDMNIGKAFIRFMGAYERQFLVTNKYEIDNVSGELTLGEVVMRNPNSFQFDFDFRIPVLKAFDVQFNVNYYNILTDATEETSINPHDQNMRLRVVGGVAYRFML